ncbi:MAG: mechanosensitive ion channel [Gemmatimonadales bacterium]
MASRWRWRYRAVTGDLFASLSIAFDKPFEVGDFVVIEDLAGTVEQVGLKTTRIRSLSGEQLVFSNANLLSSRIRNYRRMQERRVAFEFGVTYQTSEEVLRQLPGVMREIIEGEDEARFDRAHFKSFGDFALIFEVVYYVLDRDFTRYMDVQQRINLAMYSRFAALGAEFAYPTQTLFTVKTDAPATRSGLRISLTSIC